MFCIFVMLYLCTWYQITIIQYTYLFVWSWCTWCWTVGKKSDPLILHCVFHLERCIFLRNNSFEKLNPEKLFWDLQSLKILNKLVVLSTNEHFPKLNCFVLQIINHNYNIVINSGQYYLRLFTNIISKQREGSNPNYYKSNSSSIDNTECLSNKLNDAWGNVHIIANK